MPTAAQSTARQVPAIVEEVLGELRRASELSELDDEAALASALEFAIAATVRSAVSAFEGGLGCPEGLTVEMRVVARTWASEELPVAMLERVCRAIHGAIWARWFDNINAIDATPDQRYHTAKKVSSFMFGYMDATAALVDREYYNRRSELGLDRDQQRMHIVRELLLGNTTDAAKLAYDVGLHHLGAMASGPDAPGFLRDLAESAGAHLLVVPASDGTLWAWLGRRQAWTSAAMPRGLRPPERLKVGFGDPAVGKDGFRSTHRQAQAVYRIARLRAAPVVGYDDVALEVLAGADRAAAEAFVRRELKGLAEDSTQTRMLRETLAAYFKSAHNASATASRLKVHEQTVGNRLRTIEGVLQRPVGTRRAELETALRLSEILPTAPTDERRAGERRFSRPVGSNA